MHAYPAEHFHMATLMDGLNACAAFILRAALQPRLGSKGMCQLLTS